MSLLKLQFLILLPMLLGLAWNPASEIVGFIIFHQMHACKLVTLSPTHTHKNTRTVWSQWTRCSEDFTRVDDNNTCYCNAIHLFNKHTFKQVEKWYLNFLCQQSLIHRNMAMWFCFVTVWDRYPTYSDYIQVVEALFVKVPFLKGCTWEWLCKYLSFGL